MAKKEVIHNNTKLNEALKRTTYNSLSLKPKLLLMKPYRTVHRSESTSYPLKMYTTSYVTLTSYLKHKYYTIWPSTAQTDLRSYQTAIHLSKSTRKLVSQLLKHWKPL